MVKLHTALIAVAQSLCDSCTNEDAIASTDNEPPTALKRNHNLRTF